MRKRKKGRKFSRKTDQRKALFKSLANSFFLKEKMTTSLAKAKAMSVFTEKLITLAKNGGLFSTRILARNLLPKIVKKLTDEIAPRYKERRGGYTRIIKLGPRKSDGAKMAIIELVK